MVSSLFVCSITKRSVSQVMKNYVNSPSELKNKIIFDFNDQKNMQHKNNEIERDFRRG